MFYVFYIFLFCIICKVKLEKIISLLLHFPPIFVSNFCEIKNQMDLNVRRRSVFLGFQQTFCEQHIDEVKCAWNVIMQILPIGITVKIHYGFQM